MLASHKPEDCPEAGKCLFFKYFFELIPLSFITVPVRHTPSEPLAFIGIYLRGFFYISPVTGCPYFCPINYPDDDYFSF